MPKSTGRLFPKSFEGQAPREFGIGANIVKTRTFNLTAARNLETVDIGGSCLWAIAATSLGATIDIYINDQLRDPITFSQGMFVRGIPFSRLYVSHAAQAGETITLFFAVEEDVQNIQIVNPSLAFTEVTITKSINYNATIDVILAAGARTLIHTGLATRRIILVTSVDTNISVIRVGGGMAAANRGTPLAPGETLSLKTIGFVYGWNPGIMAQTIAISQTID